MRAVLAWCCVLAMTLAVDAQQIAVGRIELMPNKPSPYLMRNWKAAAWGFDSIAFDVARTGQYLPLTSMNSGTLNYPAHPSFRMQTVVGSTVPTSAEAITCLPAVIGGTLAGIDKSNQQGVDWVLMCEEWFNKKNGQNLYLNHPNASTGDDWWYETMPNVFFYQLFSLYPTEGSFGIQYGTIANRWLSAVSAMGGSTAPWHVPNMNHRAWNFATMAPEDAGVHEPEAAGAIAWLLYHAYATTGEERYRAGAEQAMEFLNGLSVNPSYELQLSYGTLTAARMNAEVGTEYDVEKLVNWCFDIGPLRSWGATTGVWGGNDCSGLIGEVYDNDYAFAMNTFEQIGALVPLVRYDDRFARAIGKWVLNAANASRLFYSGYLPQANQDSYAWAQQYDPNSSIAHEAMRRLSPANASISPYATGDAIQGGWGATNLALYSSSHVGILGGIIDTTNVPGILRLDVLKTDYAYGPAYPTYLYYNPDSAQRTVSVAVGSGSHDIYDAVTNVFLVRGATISADCAIPPNSAILAVVTPASGTETYDLDKTLVDGVVIDFRSGRAVSNIPPRIKGFAPDSSLVLTNASIQVYCTATDPNHDSLAYAWSASAGTIQGTDAQVTWTSPDSSCTASIICTVSDGHGGVVSDTTLIQVVHSINRSPVLLRIQAVPRKLDLQSSSTIFCTATDPDGDSLSYTWTSGVGTVVGNGSTVTWSHPATEGNYYVACMIGDGRGGTVLDSVGIEVRDFSKLGSAQLVAFYPFNGNAQDATLNHLDGVVSGAVPVADRWGTPGGAYAFDGTSSSVRIPNDSLLNFQNAITVNFWMKLGAAYTSREQYVVSHGNWQNRWKVSVSPVSNKLRWTVKTTAGILDLDSESPLVVDSLYNVTVLYGLSDMEIYLNRALDAFTAFSGSILQTSVDLTVGQALPLDNNYNFNGTVDDLRIYDGPLSPPQISSLYDLSTSVRRDLSAAPPTGFGLEQNFPNPFNPSTTIRFAVPRESYVRLNVYDVLGRCIETLVEGNLGAGVHSVVWNAGRSATGVYFCRLQSGSATFVRTMQVMR